MEELKVVINLKEGYALIGVQRKDTDPFVERVTSDSLEDVMNAVMEVIAHAEERWEQSPRNPESKLPPAPPTPSSPPRSAQQSREGAMQRLF